MTSMYTEDKEDRWNQAEDDDEDEMRETIKNRQPYRYRFGEHVKAKFIFLFCCCFK